MFLLVSATDRVEIDVRRQCDCSPGIHRTQTASVIAIKIVVRAAIDIWYQDVSTVNNRGLRIHYAFLQCGGGYHWLNRGAGGINTGNCTIEKRLVFIFGQLVIIVMAYALREQVIVKT